MGSLPGIFQREEISDWQELESNSSTRAAGVGHAAICKDAGFLEIKEKKTH